MHGCGHGRGDGDGRGPWTRHGHGHGHGHGWASSLLPLVWAWMWPSRLGWWCGCCHGRHMHGVPSSMAHTFSGAKWWVWSGRLSILHLTLSRSSSDSKRKGSVAPKATGEGTWWPKNSMSYVVLGPWRAAAGQFLSGVRKPPPFWLTSRDDVGSLQGRLSPAVFCRNWEQEFLGDRRGQRKQEKEHEGPHGSQCHSPHFSPRCDQ